MALAVKQDSRPLTMVLLSVSQVYAPQSALEVIAQAGKGEQGDPMVRPALLNSQAVTYDPPPRPPTPHISRAVCTIMHLCPSKH